MNAQMPLWVLRSSTIWPPPKDGWELSANWHESCESAASWWLLSGLWNNRIERWSLLRLKKRASIDVESSFVLNLLFLYNTSSEIIFDLLFSLCKIFQFESQDVLVPWERMRTTSGDEKVSGDERETMSTTSDDEAHHYCAYTQTSDSDSSKSHRLVLQLRYLHNWNMCN